MEPHEHLVRVAPEVDLRVLEWAAAGDAGADPGFLLVHGLASNARLWTGLAEELAGAGHRAVAVDLRGHGASSAPDDGYDFATVTSDLVAVIGAVELVRPVVVGQSWGGNIVLELGRRHPGEVAGVVCVDGGVIELARAFPDWDTCRAALTPPPLAGMPYADIERAIRSHHPDWPEAGIQGTLANFDLRADGTITPHLTLDRHLTILRHLWEHHPSRTFGEIGVPVLLLPVEDAHGTDRTGRKRSAVDQAVASIPTAHAHWFTGDHDVHAQSPGAVAEVILGAVSNGWLTGDGAVGMTGQDPSPADGSPASEER